MVNDDQYTPIKLRNEIIGEIDILREKNPFLRTRPDVLKYVLHRYVEDMNKNNGTDNCLCGSTLQQTGDTQ